MPHRIASVAVDHASYSYDKLYDYLVPDGLTLEAGMRVVVPFGRGADRLGLVTALREQPEVDSRLRSILAAADTEPMLDSHLLALLRWLRDNTYCTWWDAVRVLLPAGMGQRLDLCYTATASPPDHELTGREQELLAELARKRKPATAAAFAEKFPDAAELLERLALCGAATGEQLVTRRAGDATVTMVELADDWESALLTPKQRIAAELLSTLGETSVKELCYYAGVTKGVVDNLVGAGAAQYYTQETFRDPFATADRANPAPPPPLTDTQQRAVERLWQQYNNDSGSVSLLYGVTGSGKTQVFLELAHRVVQSGKQAIVLVPEISLTPQTIEKFHSHFGERVAVLHSALSLTERLDEWKRIKKNLVDVVVGTRSAVFAPLGRLGLVVIDEEQEHTYRSESSPRFDARDVARVRVKLAGGLLLLASATPSVDSYHRATTSEYTLVELDGRYGTARLPDVTILDMRVNTSATEGLSELLCEEILYNLSHNEQTILLMNRRGHSTSVKCMSCHKPAECPNCSVALKYHAANNRLMCHYCGYSEAVQGRCSECGSEYMRFSGLGTQKVEEELRARFPDARVLRMDADSTMQKLSHQRSLGDFRDGNYDIMVGTQMVAKGLNFPNVTLVGVLGIDQSLYSDDFRSYERVFSLITQVVGRSGRDGNKPGRAFIQTYTPENPIILAAAQQQFANFFHDEIASRKFSLYPPYCRLYCVGISGVVENDAAKGAQAVMGELQRLLSQEYTDIPVRLLGLSPEAVYKVAGRYRYHIIVKVRHDKRTRQLFSHLLEWCGKGVPDGVTVFVNPNY